jgi:hypothetical protein
MPLKISRLTFLFQVFQYKRYFNVLLMIIKAQFTTLNSKLSNSNGLQRRTPLPHNEVQGVGEYWLFLSYSREFGCGF